MHYEESGDGHGPPGSEACSLGILHAQRSILLHSGSTNIQTCIFLPLVLNSTGLQRYLVTIE